MPAAALLLLGAACPVGPGVDGTVAVAPPGSPAVRLTYLGVGGWIFERGDAQVLTAPLFSNPSFLGAGLRGVASDSAAVDRGMGPYDVREALAILVGHGHYDHLMDVPRVARAHAPRARILGSRTTANLLGRWAGVEDRVWVVADSAGDAGQAGRWIHLRHDVRVMPLRSTHAPHFDGYTLYRGTTSEPLEAAPRWATEWVDGETLSYLVDFLDPDGSVAFRIYYQDAVSPPPAGMAAQEVVGPRRTDVAILVPATFDQVDWHPEAFVENLRPRWVLLGHWENFFVPPAPPSRSMSTTDMAHFEGRLRRVHSGRFWRPEIGTVFLFPTGGPPADGITAAAARPGTGSGPGVPPDPR